MNASMSRIYRGTLDSDGLFVKGLGGNFRIRYDASGELWCCDHNCRLSLCKDKIHPPKHGGRRVGAGRKSSLRDPDKKLRPIWCWTTEDEQQLINKSLTADERAAILLKVIGVNLP